MPVMAGFGGRRSLAVNPFIRIPKNLCRFFHIIGVAYGFEILGIITHGAEGVDGFALQALVALVLLIGPVIGAHR